MPVLTALEALALIASTMTIGVILSLAIVAEIRSHDKDL